MSDLALRPPRNMLRIALFAAVSLLVLLAVAALLAIDWGRPGEAKVSGECRDAVGLAAYSLDGWKTIRDACTADELSALTAEFRARGVSPEHLNLARRGS